MYNRDKNDDPGNYTICSFEPFLPQFYCMLNSAVLSGTIISSENSLEYRLTIITITSFFSFYFVYVNFFQKKIYLCLGSAHTVFLDVQNFVQMYTFSMCVCPIWVAFIKRNKYLFFYVNFIFGILILSLPRPSFLHWSCP